MISAHKSTPSEKGPFSPVAEAAGLPWGQPLEDGVGTHAARPLIRPTGTLIDKNEFRQFHVSFYS